MKPNHRIRACYMRHNSPLKTTFVNLKQLQAAASQMPKPDIPEPMRYALELSPGAVRLTRTSNIESNTKPPGYKPRTSIDEWSDKSRANMVKRLCTLDYQPLLGKPNRIPALITLTYPGNWQTVVPDGKTAKRHLKVFRARYERRWGEALLAVWKMEFQRRGAVHFHLYTAPPSDPSFAEWLSATWAHIVNHPDPNEYAKHLTAGTGIDYNTGARSTDPKRVAVYFSKHNSPNKGTKEYQNQPPQEWLTAGSVGRFWGYWKLKPLTVTAELTHLNAIKAARILRRWAKANSTPKKVKVWRTNLRTGECKQRKATRRTTPKLKQSIGFLATSDGAALGTHIAKAINVLDCM